ncbi:hypothetical protein GRJ2_002523100 [Grus japonensis]|uniref:Uncharacterized protein n=1 Tax=Grus japonensis TaxID=30415 RepID=A0ABC9XSF1_GRUJA
MAVALGVATLVLVVALPILLCRPAVGFAMAGNSSVEVARLEEAQRGLRELVATLELALGVTNQSLAEARGQWDGYRKQLGALEGKVSELEQALARVTQLQEENRALKAEVAQQQEQLGDLRSSRDKLQLQNQLLQNELQAMRSQHSGGNGLPATSLSLLALLLLGMLLL